MPPNKLKTQQRIMKRRDAGILQIVLSPWCGKDFAKSSEYEHVEKQLKHHPKHVSQVRINVTSMQHKLRNHVLDLVITRAELPLRLCSTGPRRSSNTVLTVHSAPRKGDGCKNMHLSA